MTKDSEIYEKMNTIFRTIFDVDDLTLEPTTSAETVEGWDSFQHINIVVAVESAFGVKFTTTEIEALKNVGDFVALIRRRTSDS